MNTTKLSKKKTKEINNKKRGTWLGINPVTKIVPAKKGEKYNRTKQKKENNQELKSNNWKRAQI